MATLESMLAPKMELSFSSVVESGAPLAVWKQTTYQPSSQLSAEMVEVPFNLKPLPSLMEIEQQYRDCEDTCYTNNIKRKPHEPETNSAD